MDKMGVCSYITSTNWGEKIISNYVTVFRTNFKFAEKRYSWHEREKQEKKIFTAQKVYIKNDIIFAKSKQSGNPGEEAVGKEQFILIFGVWLRSNSLPIISQLLKLRTTECTSLTQMKLIFNFPQKLLKQVGHLDLMNFSCTSYWTTRILLYRCSYPRKLGQ